MGFFDRAIDGVNWVARPLQSLSTPRDPRLVKAARLQERGERAAAKIVGIARDHPGDMIETIYALEVVASPTEAPLRFGVQVTTTPHLHLLRYGVTVPVRVDGRRGVIDWPALAQACGITDGEPGQRIKQVPADGIHELAPSAAERRLLKGGTRQSATIERLDRCHVLGAPTVNWDVRLRLADGSVATVSEDQVPPYAWWIAAPGSTVPAIVDPEHASRAMVDWAAAALTAGADSPDLQDRPPDGSLGAEALTPPPEPARVVDATPTDPRSVIAANRDVGVVNATLREWVAEVHAGRMKPKAFLRAVADWESAGLCTADEAAAARASAGVGV